MGADITYVSTWSGWVCVAFVVDAYARRILGWRTGTSMTTQFVLDALEQAIWTRGRDGHVDLTGLIHHHDHGSLGGLNRSSQHLVITRCSMGRRQQEADRALRPAMRSPGRSMPAI